MNTTIHMIPSATTPLQSSVLLSPNWMSQLALETDAAYGFTVDFGGNRVYRGSLKLIAEESANNSGTRRLLLKVELPLSHGAAASAGDGCCCQQAAGDETPTVSVHTVITVPKQVAAGLVQNETAAFDHVTAAVRLLQNALGSICFKQVTASDENGGVVADGAIITKSIPDNDDGTVIMPIRYSEGDNRFYVDAGIPSTAPIWGLIGGLRSISA